jgi:hypothetical protein
MSMINLLAPTEEQKICLTCGFCCDATIFLHAHLKPDEPGNIPAKMEETVFYEKGEYYFVQPCPYFEGKCKIYDQLRADVCGTYRCQLLKDLSAGKITGEEALGVVADAMEMRIKIIEDFSRLAGRKQPVSFRYLLAELGKMARDSDNDPESRQEVEMLQARCNVFEMLLIKHFRSAEEFEKMIMK